MMMRAAILALCGLVALRPDLRAEAAAVESTLALGIDQYTAGDLEAALFSLDAAAQRLRANPPRVDLLTRAYVYLGAVHVDLGQEEKARKVFREALRLEPEHAITRTDFPRKVQRVWDAAVLEAAAARKKGRGHAAWAAGAIGAAVVGATAMIGGEQISNRSPTTTVSFAPSGRMIAGVTTVRVWASAMDPDGEELTFVWDMGDGTRLSGATVLHRYEREGTYRPTVVVKDTRGGAATAAADPIEVRSLSGTWSRGPCATCVVQWTQNGMMVTIDGPPLTAGPWVGARLADPRQLTLEVMSVGRVSAYVGEMNAALDEVWVMGGPSGSGGIRFQRQ